MRFKKKKKEKKVNGAMVAALHPFGDTKSVGVQSFRDAKLWLFFFVDFVIVLSWYEGHVDFGLGSQTGHTDRL